MRGNLIEMKEDDLRMKSTHSSGRDERVETDFSHEIYDVSRRETSDILQMLFEDVFHFFLRVAPSRSENVLQEHLYDR